MLNHVLVLDHHKQHLQKRVIAVIGFSAQSAKKRYRVTAGTAYLMTGTVQSCDVHRDLPQ